MKASCGRIVSICIILCKEYQTYEIEIFVIRILTLDDLLGLGVDRGRLSVVNLLNQVEGDVLALLAGLEGDRGGISKLELFGVEGGRRDISALALQVEGDVEGVARRLLVLLDR